MKKPSLQEIVLKHTLPNPKGNDPTTFFGHVQRNLVPEVRHEVQVFYGSLDCLEAQYPGLDYTYAPHRRRLGRYPWHRRLFRTFDELSLTSHEILSLCQWEGTRSAKERYEAETKRKIRDTTADDIAVGPVSEGPQARMYYWHNVPMETDGPDVGNQPSDIEAETDQSDEDDLANSIGVQLNEQLQAAVEARSRGEEATVDSAWEQWMKEAIERNDLNGEALLQAVREGRLLSQMIDAPLNSQNSTERVQRALQRIAAAPDDDSSQSDDPPEIHPQITQRYDNLRTMLSDLQSANNQLAADNVQLAMILNRGQPEAAS